jgi:hypothetical protein
MEMHPPSQFRTVSTDENQPADLDLVRSAGFVVVSIDRQRRVNTEPRRNTEATADWCSTVSDLDVILSAVRPVLRER